MEVLTWQARNERGLTLKQLEAATGIGKTTLNNIENGLVSPTLNQLEAIARALDVKMSDLYDSVYNCLLYTSPSPRDRQKSRMPSSA